MTKREKTITEMCYRERHDFGLYFNTKNPISGGLRPEERKALWNMMADIYDTWIEPNRVNYKPRFYFIKTLYYKIFK